MTIGAAIFLVAAGAILRYAVEDSIEGVDLATVGLILMIAGAIGLLIGLWMAIAARRRYDAAYADPAYDPAYRDPAAYPQQQPPAQAPPPQAPPQQRY
jgi:Domain of unknown function (DUF6458)